MPNAHVAATATGLPKSRRTVLASIAGLAALSSCATIAPAAASICKAAPYVPATSEESAASSDAELVRLGIAFDQAMEVWMPIWREMWRLHEVWALTVKERRLTFANDEAEIWRINSELRGDLAEAENEAAIEVLDQIAEQIRAIRPCTIRGLAAHAKVARYEGTSPNDRETPRKDQDLDVQALLGFFAMVEEFAS